MRFVPVFLILFLSSLSLSAREMRVVGSRVNLRARPDLHSEVIGQVERGDIVVAKSVTDTWIEIAPPQDAEFWVHGDFVEGDVVVGSRLNVRSGPGVSFAIMATLERGDTIQRVGEFGEWISILAPVGASVWIALDLVMPLEPDPTPTPPEPLTPPVARPVPDKPPEPVEPGTPPPAPAPTPLPAPVVTRPAPPPPADLVLIPLEGQGEAVQLEGVLRPAGFVIGRPSRYRLTHQRGNTIETLAYVRGNQTQLQSLLGHALRIDGHRYWVQGARHPVIVPEQIILISPVGE